MATINLRVSDETFAELQAKANAEGRTLDEVAESALLKGLNEQSWEDLLAYGLQRGKESGYSVEDVPRLVRENRARHR